MVDVILDAKNFRLSEVGLAALLQVAEFSIRRILQVFEMCESMVTL